MASGTAHPRRTIFLYSTPLGSLIFQKEMVFDNGSILYCLIKTKHFLSSHPLPSPSMELLRSIKTFLNLRLFQSYCKLGCGQPCVQTRCVTLSAVRHPLSLQLGRGTASGRMCVMSLKTLSLVRAFVCR